MLRIKAPRAGSFLGFAAGRHSGSATVTWRMKASPGAARVDWLPGGVAAQAYSAPYVVTEEKLQTITVTLPAKEALGIVRIYLPESKADVEIDWIQITTQGHDSRTDF
jgi:hypothetical protein